MHCSHRLTAGILAALALGVPAEPPLDTMGTLFSRFHDDFERPAEFLGRKEGSFSGDAKLAAKWEILRGTVDVVKRSPRYGFLTRDRSSIPSPDSQGYVLDLEGSVNDAQTPAKIRTVHGFQAGTYRLTFKLAGTNRTWEVVPEASFPYTAEISFGKYGQRITLPYRQPFRTFDTIVTVPSGTHLVMDAICPYPSRAMAGLLLDDVRVVPVR